jgi:hypothetical protein
MSLANSPVFTSSQTDAPRPLERLQVSDGLLITANHWQRAHYYHRQYQSLHYQALQESGIVKGLGIYLIEAPAEIPSKYRDARWIQVQPGLAIDQFGHAIVVPETMDFRVASEAPTTGKTIVYIVLRYVDPDQLQASSSAQSEFVQETFRIDETTNLPDDEDIVLCRILLEPGTVTLEPTYNVFSPIANQVDLRDRKSVQAKSQIEVQVGTFVYPAEADRNPWFELLRSLTTLYPAMQGKVQSLNQSVDFTGYDLLHLTQDQFVTLADSRFESVKTTLKSGTILLIEASTQGSPIAKLGKLHHELQQAIAQAKRESNSGIILSELETECAAIAEDLNQQFQPIHQAVQSMITQLGLQPDMAEETAAVATNSVADDEDKETTNDISNLSATPKLGQSDGVIDRSHLLRRQPFLFSQFPTVNEHPLYLWNWGNIILAIGDLSRSWDLDPHDQDFMTSRESLRNAHEFGINLLQFATSHHHLTQLQAAPLIGSRSQI